jgi:hypothetical protein
MSFWGLSIAPTTINTVKMHTRQPPDHSTPWGHAPDNQTDEIERATHNMNYYVLIVFHADVDMRPCSPIVRIVALEKEADIRQEEILLNPRGVQMRTTCQLCDNCINTTQQFGIDMFKLLSVYALRITDDEASRLINNVADINTNVSQNQTTLSERSNVSLIPRSMHRSVQMGVRSIVQIRTASSATDVQLSIILLRESLNSARSVCVELRALHPYLATPENFQDALSTFTRSLDKHAFRRDCFKFAVL